ncbi:hypothetical protein [Halomonas faecis]|uniref:hypothetical protein n=1 Tax=Halomonas faecis TaxID=1562110 RepID=UPI0013D0D6C7|nr:hypothetical protein [Halomonas faecis]
MSPSPRLLRPLALLTVVIGLPAHGDGDNAGVDATAWFAQLGDSASPESPECPS